MAIETSLNLPNVDQLFGPGGIDLNAPLDPGSSAFNKFLSQHKLAMAEDNVSNVGVKSVETSSREQGTSRFARFFTNNTDESSQESDNTQKNSRFPISPAQSPSESKPVPITLDTLFQSSVSPPTAAPLSPRMKSSEGAGARMLTEDEVLQTLGAKPTLKPEIKEKNQESEAMLKIYAALKKGPVSYKITFT